MVLYWGICRTATRPGACIGTSDLCHLHTTRGSAVGCGISRPGDPELVAVRATDAGRRIYRVVYSLSHAAGGRLRGGRQ